MIKRILKYFGFLVGGLLVLFLLLIAVAFLTADHSPVGHWKSDEGMRLFDTAYNAAMALLPEPANTYDVSTDFGTVRVYAWVPENAVGTTPVILAPGRSSGVPMWYKNLPEIAKTRHVYAFDSLGDSGQSVQTAEIKDMADQVAWMDQMFNELSIQRAHLVGHSFGGLMMASYASVHPERVASLALIEPAFTFASLPPETMLYAMLSTLPLPEKWTEHFMNKISGTDAGEVAADDPVAEMIYAGTKYFSAKIPAPEQITPEQMRSWPMPVFGAIAENSPIHDPQAALRAAEENIQNITVRIWPQATHALPMEFPEEINRELLTFFREND